MGVYRVTTDQGTYEVTTDDGQQDSNVIATPTAATSEMGPPLDTSVALGDAAGAINYAKDKILGNANGVNPNMSFDDYLQTTPSKFKIEVDPSKIVGGLGDIFNGMTFGLGDEAIGGTAGAINYAKDKVKSILGNTDGINPNMSFNDYLQTGATQMEDLRKGFNQANPISGITTEVGGALLNPISLADYIKGTTVAGKLGAAGVNAGLLGAGYGFGNTDGNISDRIQGAEDAGLPSSMFGVAAAGTGQLLQNIGEDILKPLGDRFQRSALGIRASDLKKAANDVAPSAPNPILQGVEEMRGAGGFKDGVAPEDLLNATEKQAGDINAELKPILAQADTLGGNNLLPSFPKTDKLVSTLKGSDFKDASNIYQKEVSDLIDTLDNGGTLNDWQAAKTSLQGNSKYGTETSALRNDIRKSIASDIKTFIENQADTLLPNDAGKVKSLNNSLSLRYRLNDVFNRGKINDLGASPITNLKNTFRTSGGFGVPILAAVTAGGAAGYHSGNLRNGLLTGLGAAALASRGGQFMTGSALRSVADITPEFLSTVTSRALNPHISEPHTVVIPPKPKALIPIEKKTGAESFPDPEKLLPTKPSLKASTYTPQQISTESNGDPSVVSNKGATGLMQLEPSAMRDVMRASRPKIDDKQFTDDQLRAMAKNPELNIKYGQAYMQLMLDKYHDPTLAAAAYNAGPGAVDKYGGVPPYKETQNYVKKVIGRYAS